MGGVALLPAWGAWSVGVAQSMLGDPSSLRLGSWVGWWMAALLPAAIGGMVEDATQRLTVRYRLLLTIPGKLLGAGQRATRLGFCWWLDTVLIGAPWLGFAIALLAVTGLPHAFNIIDGYNGLAGMVALIVCLALAHVALQVGDRSLAALLVSSAAATAVSSAELPARHAVCR